MSAQVALPLRYVLHTSSIALTATLRLAVAVDDAGGHLEPEVEVGLSAPWHPEPLTTTRRLLPPEGGLATSRPSRFRQLA